MPSHKCGGIFSPKPQLLTTQKTTQKTARKSLQKLSHNCNAKKAFKKVLPLRYHQAIATLTAIFNRVKIVLLDDV